MFQRIASQSYRMQWRLFIEDENQIALGLNYTNDKSLHEIEAYDISLLKLLSNGYILEEISRGSKNRVIPNGSSSISALIN
jgi:hypothetical protein